MQNDNELQREADEAVRVLKEGGIILYPTDTVWGLGCDATNAEAVERIYKLKRSENKKSMLVLCASADMVVRYVNRAPVQLVHHEEHGLGRLAQDARNGLVVGVDPGLAVHEEQDDVRLVRAGQRLIAYGALEGVVIAHLDAAGIDELEIDAVPVGLMIGAVARDAAHLVDDGLVGLGYAVDEGGLADVRPSDHRDDG